MTDHGMSTKTRTVKEKKMYKKDWILNQIQTLINLLVKLVLHKDSAVYEIQGTSATSKEDQLYLQLDHLICENKINEAENLLFDTLEANHPEYLEVAFDFYNKLNLLDDSILEKNDFARAEIEQGLQDIMDIYGICLNWNI